MNPILASISSALLFKWVPILILILGLAGGLYWQHRTIVNSEKELALQQYNINQLQQNVKDNQTYIEQLTKLNNFKGDLVANLYVERDALEEKLLKIQSTITTNVATGNDRGSSKVLKDLFKQLGEMK